MFLGTSYLSPHAPSPNAPSPKRVDPPRALRVTGLVVALLLAALPLGGCGGSSSHPPLNGIILVDNVTDTTTNEILFTFFISPFGQPWTGDLLGGDLFPTESRSLGVFGEDYYDAEGDMELGDIILWFDIFVGEGGTTVFEVL